MFNVNIDTKEVQGWLNKNQKKIPEIGEKSVDRTSAYGLNELRTTLPKKSGNLRNSSNVKKESKIFHIIFNNAKYANAIEDGYPEHTIYPTSGHTFLTIPLHKNVLTKSGSQIKQSSLNRLFKYVGYNKKINKLYPKGELEDNSINDIFNFVGIALARKATIPAFGGTHTIRDIIMPKINRFFTNEVDSRIKEIL